MACQVREPYRPNLWLLESLVATLLACIRFGCQIADHAGGGGNGVASGRRRQKRLPYLLAYLFHRLVAGLLRQSTGRLMHR